MNKINLNSQQALKIIKNNNFFELKFGNLEINELKKNEVIIENHYSNINFKDTLICSGNPGLVRRYPHVAGIDTAGIVKYSKSKKFKVGEKVFILGHPLGVKSFGGYSKFTKAPDNWIEKLPKGISLREIMIFGTAGFTALIVLDKILKSKIKNDLPILVTGSSGGVGSIIVHLLARNGFRVIASTSRKSNYSFLSRIGANEVIYQDMYLEKNLPLMKETYSFIVDTTGGKGIENRLNLLCAKGTYFLIGNSTGENFQCNILPFILRGISLVGINTENVDKFNRNKIIKNIANMKNICDLSLLSKEINFKELKKYINLVKKNKHQGRIVVKII